MRVLFVVAALVAASGCTSFDAASPADLRLAHDDSTVPSLPPPMRAPTPNPAYTPAADSEPSEVQDAELEDAAHDEEPDPDPLSASAGGPYAGAALEWVALEATYEGGVGDVVCTWSGTNVTFQDDACTTAVQVPGPGSYNLSLVVTRGDGSVESEAILEAAMPEPDGSIEGTLHIYDAELDSDLGGLFAAAGEKPTYIAGRDVQLSARFVEADIELADARAEAFILDTDGNSLLGPVPASVEEDVVLGEPSGMRFDTDALTLDLEAGSYLLAFRVEQSLWVAHEGGHYAFDVVAGP